MIPYHNIDPVILSFGTLKVSWYSLSYVIGIIFAWYYAVFLSKKFKLSITPRQIENFITWVIISIIIGGRLGYVLFYELDEYLDDPIEIFKTYNGGMSFHGAIIGVMLGAFFYTRKYNLSLVLFFDLLSVTAPAGIFLGRIANFINGELYGRITDVSWAVVFPYGGPFPRHPSQLYEALGEGLLLFIIMNILVFKFNSLKKPWLSSSVFFIGYGFARFICELFREPEHMLGPFTEGQVLSIPMIILGICLLKRK